MAWFSNKKKQSFNCHFCNKNTTTPNHYKQGWICPDPMCAQYNGFTENGDYNLNIMKEFPPNHSNNNNYCKPSKIPFKIPNNIFQSNSHFSSNTYIPSTSSAPLCPKCQQHESIIQQKLSEFDAGANSNYNAFTQYRQLLQDKYPLCNHCQSQCKYQLNAINHNARLWQKYQDSLATPNLNAFKLKNKVNTNKNYCCSSFLPCVINTLMIYLSFFITVIGLSTYCQTNLSNAFDIIHKCNIKLFLRMHSCLDLPSEYWTPCLYIHNIKHEMSRYLLVSNHIILSGILLLFIFICYDRTKHNFFCYILLLFSCILLIFIPIVNAVYDTDGFMLFSDEINILLQIGMFFFCLLFTICCKCVTGNDKKTVRKIVEIEQRIQHNESNELLNLLEQDEMKENMQSQTPFFPSFGVDGNKNNNSFKDQWKNVNDPFQKANDNYYNAYNTKPINPYYGDYINNNNNNGISHEPMDVCNTPIRQRSANRNISSVRNGINSLDLSDAFS